MSNKCKYHICSDCIFCLLNHENNHLYCALTLKEVDIYDAIKCRVYADSFDIDEEAISIYMARLIDRIGHCLFENIHLKSESK